MGRATFRPRTTIYWVRAGDVKKDFVTFVGCGIVEQIVCQSGSDVLSPANRFLD